MAGEAVSNRNVPYTAQLYPMNSVESFDFSRELCDSGGLREPRVLARRAAEKGAWQRRVAEKGCSISQYHCRCFATYRIIDGFASSSCSTLKRSGAPAQIEKKGRRSLIV